MYFDRCDVIEAFYLFFVDYHKGQWSKEYRRLSKMLRYFKPSPLLRVESLTENARGIYDRLVATAS